MSAVSQDSAILTPAGGRTGSGRSFGALWLIVPGALFLGFLMAFPVLQLLSVSIRDPDSGAWSLAAYYKIFASATYLRILSTTFVLAVETTLLSLVIGYPMAYWLARLSERRRSVLILLVLIPFWTSALVKNFVWLVLLGRTGIAIKIAVWFGAPDTIELLFSHLTVLFGMVHTMLPLAIITMLPTMLKVDTRLPLAAATLGASNAHAFWRIYFPLSMPGVAAAGLLVLVASFGFFVTPALLGSPQETMIGQVIISQILALHNWPFGAALTTMLIVSALMVCLIYNRLFGLTAISGANQSTGRSDTITHRLGTALLKAVASTHAAILERPFGRSKAGPRSGWFMMAYASIVVVILLLPIVALLPMAFTTSTFLSFPPPLGTTKWFGTYLESPIWIAATLRSFGIGFACACLTFLITFPAAYGVARTGGKIGTATFLFFMAPMIIPNIGISLALFYLFSQLKLVATDIGIVLGHTVLAIPTVFVISLATMKSYDWRLNDAAATLGANKWRTVLRINLPLMKGGVLAGMIFAFLLSFEELTVVMFVGAGFKTTLPKQMWDDILLQLNPTLAAASVFVLLIVVTLFLVAEYLRPRR